MSTLPRSGAPSPPALLVAYPRRLGASEHDTASHHALAAKLASLLGCACDIDYRAGRAAPRRTARVYYVPAITLAGPAAKRLGIRAESDLFGGVVPYEFVATKAITHATVAGARAQPPAGWAAGLGTALRPYVLPGYTAFSTEDALMAGALLLRGGPVRIKPVRATAGRGQSTVHDHAELREALRAMDPDEIAQCGLVVEEHLDDVITYSVGTVRLPGLSASYVGTQRLTTDNHGQKVYGGSDMLFVRGGFDALSAQRWPRALQLAIDLARRYDAAVEESYPDFFASRRNYDVAAGRARNGECHRGVLEQSWRAGGASMAEACAMEAFQGEPGLCRVRARTTECYGAQPDAPVDATLVYDGEDPAVGRIRKSAGIVRHGNA